MRANNKHINWIPFLSICSSFILVGVIGWFLGVEAKPLAIGFGVMGGLTSIANLFPPEFNFKNYWYTGIMPEAHIILIVLTVVCSLFFLFFVIPKYEFNLSIKRKP